MKIEIKKIIPNPQQPRSRFDQEQLDELAASMANPAVGLVQPIVVEPGDDDQFVLVDGERRLRAAKMLDWTHIEAVVRDRSNHNGTERLIQAFVAKEQRSDMNAMERARAYGTMIQALGSVAEVSRYTGKSNATIYSYLALLDLEAQIQALFERGALIVSPRVISALKRLEPSKRVPVAVSAASRGVSEAVFLAMCKRVEAKPVQRRQPRESAAALAPGEHFDALKLVGSKFLPEMVVNPARATCKACDLYDMASATTCRQCPLVDFLRRV